jgi:hypothetical protein
VEDTPVVSFTDFITTTKMDVTQEVHTCFVKATNASGASLPSSTWSLDVLICSSTLSPTS